MSLGWDVAAALPGLRRAAESRMTDWCEIISNPDATLWDSETLTETEAPATFSYRGVCRVKASNTQPNGIDAAGQPLIGTSLSVHLPISKSSGVEPGHVVVVTSASKDPDLVGRRYRITGPHNQTDSTARRLPVEEILRG